MEQHSRIKKRVQARIVIVSVILMAGKFAAYLLTGSVGILTDAMESIVNVAAGCLSLYSLHVAARPRDARHPFGRGKAEMLSASVEGLLIILAGGWIIFEGVHRLFEPSMPRRLDVGIGIVALAGLVNWIAGWYSIRTGRRYSSMALIAGGKHLQSDTWSTVGLITGLILLYVTRIAWIDSLLALVFGGWIVWTGIGILSKTTAGLMDRADREVLESVRRVIAANRRREWVDIHNLKVIGYGGYFYVDCDLTLPWYYTIHEGHRACDRLSRVIGSGFSERVLVSVHADSCCERYCEHCEVWECSHRRKPYRMALVYLLSELTKSDETRRAEGQE